jgi:hypothetical protein
MQEKPRETEGELTTLLQKSQDSANIQVDNSPPPSLLKKIIKHSPFPFIFSLAFIGGGTLLGGYLGEQLAIYTHATPGSGHYQDTIVLGYLYGCVLGSCAGAVAGAAISNWLED